MQQIAKEQQAQNFNCLLHGNNDLVAETNEATLVWDTARPRRQRMRDRETCSVALPYTHTHTQSRSSTHKKFTTTTTERCRSRVTGSSCAVKVFSTTSARHTTHTSVEEKRKAFIVFCCCCKVDQSNIANAKQTRRQRWQRRRFVMPTADRRTCAVILLQT